MAIKHASAGEMIDLNAFGENRTTAVVKEKTFEVIRMIVSAGKPVPPHKVDGPITVQCISGQCKFFVGDEPREMSPGGWLYVEGGVVHALESESEAVMLVTILFKQNS